ncbi:type I secretion system permease/ATPase [Roseateles sp. LKC17W]|uniref:Type I secretion system permease/ATPase n=1 Tax=Pelomonas margarita TaxID=3299031 RepID=A0ABW7FEU6_9BURK
MNLLGQRLPLVTPLGRAMAAVRSTLGWVAFFSFFVNLLALTSSIYMMQVYDRVLASHSLPTLLGLTLFALACLLTLAGLEVVRSRLLVRLGARLDAQLSGLLFEKTLAAGRNSQALRDLDQLRGFVTGSTMLSLLDAPWMPIYIGLVYLLHPWLGHVALLGGVVLFLLGLWNERATRAALAEAGAEMAAGARFAEISARNTDVIRAMGMLPGLARLWRQRHDYGIGLQGLASDKAALVAAWAKSVRLLLQIAVLGVGAWLVIRAECTAGVMIAASIIMGRGLAPLEQAIGGWRGFLQARESYGRLRQEIGQEKPQDEPMPLPAPKGLLAFEGVSAAPPQSRRLTLQGIDFTLQPGTCLGITGPSAAGKSTLVRLAVGVWAPAAGAVRLDGARIDESPREHVGPHIGYLPQDIELFPGSVAANIARFGEVDAERVVEAAQLAGSHAMILALPEGYDTVIGPAGANLSGGQRQRIGLARAFYGNPPLIVLDEPTSNLDAEGEAAVRQGIDEMKRRQRTVLVVAHRPALLGGTDQMLVLVGGQVVKFGATQELMPQITRKSALAPEEEAARA